ncbi:MAG: MFS transporter, partial [Verrucomicrobia bacterium]|nr:MFS transporter [Verrucomicrobiota bacterium]
CQPLAVALSSPLSGWILDAWKSSSLEATTGLANWRAMLILEGALPFLWLPIWIYFINDHPRQARWISTAERAHVESILVREAAELEPGRPEPFWRALLRRQVLVMLVIYFFQNCGAYGCMFWLPSALKHAQGLRLSNTLIGLLFAGPYVLGAILMILHARHSDRTRERRGHVAAALGWGGAFFLAGVLSRSHSAWLSYACICVAITGPFCSLAPFWAIPTETLPRGVAGSAMGLINAMGNLGGFAGPFLVGYLDKVTGNFTYGFGLLGVALLLGAAMATLITPAVPLAAPQSSTSPPPSPSLPLDTPTPRSPIA